MFRGIFADEVRLKLTRGAVDRSCEASTTYIIFSENRERQRARRWGIAAWRDCPMTQNSIIEFWLYVRMYARELSRTRLGDSIRSLPLSASVPRIHRVFHVYAGRMDFWYANIAPCPRSTLIRNSLTIPLDRRKPPNDLAPSRNSTITDDRPIVVLILIDRERNVTEPTRMDLIEEASIGGTCTRLVDQFD